MSDGQEALKVLSSNTIIESKLVWDCMTALKQLAQQLRSLLNGRKVVRV